MSSIPTRQALYPVSPQGVIERLADPTAQYRIRVVFVLLSLLAFVAFYLCLLAAAGYAVYLSFSYPMALDGGGSVYLKIVLKADQPTYRVFEKSLLAQVVEIFSNEEEAIASFVL